MSSPLKKKQRIESLIKAREANKLNGNKNVRIFKGYLSDKSFTERPPQRKVGLKEKCSESASDAVDYDEECSPPEMNQGRIDGNKSASNKDRAVVQ